MTPPHGGLLEPRGSKPTLLKLDNLSHSKSTTNPQEVVQQSASLAASRTTCCTTNLLQLIEVMESDTNPTPDRGLTHESVADDAAATWRVILLQLQSSQLSSTSRNTFFFFLFKKRVPWLTT